MSLTPGGNKRKNDLNKSSQSISREGNGLLAGLKGFGLGLVGAVIKSVRGVSALAAGAIIGPIMTGLGYPKMDILKMINSPFFGDTSQDSWWKQIKDKWQAPKGNKILAGFKGFLKGVLLGIPLSLFAGALALLENGLSAIWTATVGGVKLALEAASSAKELGTIVDNSSVLSGIARTNILGTLLLTATKLLANINPRKYADKFEEYRRRYPNAIDYVKTRVQGLIENQHNAKNTMSGISTQLQERTTNLKNVAGEMKKRIEKGVANVREQVGNTINMSRGNVQNKMALAKSRVEQVSGAGKERLSATKGQVRSHMARAREEAIAAKKHAMSKINVGRTQLIQRSETAQVQTKNSKTALQSSTQLLPKKHAVLATSVKENDPRPPLLTQQRQLVQDNEIRRKTKKPPRGSKQSPRNPPSNRF